MDFEAKFHSHYTAQYQVGPRKVTKKSDIGSIHKKKCIAKMSINYGKSNSSKKENAATNMDEYYTKIERSKKDNYWIHKKVVPSVD